MAVIVTVDDDPDILTLFGLAARRGGHTVLPATNGHTALRLIRQHYADLLITDNDMPGLTGRQLAADMAADPTISDVPILMVSGSLTMHELVDGVEYVSALMTKPFQLDELRHRIDELLTNAGAGTPTAPEQR
jgi:DNA-binding response OmpR family regulator